MPSRPSRSNGALLDPYGIYGTRTANRMRASRRRRQTQNVFVALAVAGLAAGAFAFSKWQRVETRYADSVVKTRMRVSVSPVWAQAPSSKSGALLIAGEEGRMLRVDPLQPSTPGTVLLEVDFPLRAPLVWGSNAFVPSESGVLSAIAWGERRLLWRVRFDDSLTAQPTAFALGQQGASRKQLVVAGSDAGLLMALDATNGKMQWRTRLPAPIGKGLSSVEANGRARILVPLLGSAAMRGGLWCLDGATGKVLWRFPKDGRSEAIQLATPVADLAGNRVYAANDLGAVVALNLSTGTYNPKQRMGWKSFVSPIHERDAKKVVSLRATPALLKTAASNSGEPGTAPGRPGGALVVGGNDGGVRCLAVDDGSVLWRFDAEYPVVSLSPMSLGGGREAVLVSTRSPHLLLLDASRGKALQRFSSGGANFVGATTSGTKVFAVTSDGDVHQFALESDA